MADKPTQKEMDDLFVEETGFDPDDFPAAIFGFARAVLAKWGQSAQAAEPVARMQPRKIDECYGDCPTNPATCPNPCKFLGRTTASHGQAPATQPVAREPLTDAQIRAMLNKHPPEDVCGWSYRMGIDDAELHHGIKGGQNVE